MEGLQKIIVLDFEKGEVFVYDYNKNTTNEETPLEGLDHNESNCQWMIVDKLKINI